MKNLSMVFVTWEGVTCTVTIWTAWRFLVTRISSCNSQTMNRCDFDFFFPFSPASAFSVSQNLCHMLMFGRSNATLQLAHTNEDSCGQIKSFFFFIIFVGSSTSSLTPPPPGCPNPALVVATRAKTAVSSSPFHHYNLPKCPRENVYFSCMPILFNSIHLMIYSSTLDACSVSTHLLPMWLSSFRSHLLIHAATYGSNEMNDYNKF